MMQKIQSQLKVSDNLRDKLNEAYDEALKNADFKEVVSKTKLKREILVQYTSTLEECAKEYGNCKKCPGINACKNKMTGYAYLPKITDGLLEFSYRICKYKKKLDLKNSYQNNLTLYKVPEEIKEASFSKIYKTDKKRYDTILWLNDFLDKYKKDRHQKGLYLYGNFGSGKTYLISALFNELAKDNVKSAIVFWPEYLRDLKASFNSEYKGEFNDRFNSVKNAPLLLIDDIGAESATAWSRDEILCPILQYRMDEKLPTFFTSNLDLKSLENHYAITSKGDEIIKAGRIISRINQLSEYKEMISKNLRK
ncbi:MAG: primosomal protein DnaI [Bacilli bacterium]|nr:primosomal protein DnaI [Bacilli bacterium]